MEAWSRARGVTRGEVVSLDRVWALGQAWYHNRMAADFRGRTIAEAEAVFAAVGLTGPFWRAPA